MSRAILHYEQSLLLDDSFNEGRVRLSIAHEFLGDQLRSRGGDPRPEYRRALEYARKAVEQNPRDPDSQASQKRLVEKLGTDRQE